MPPGDGPGDDGDDQPDVDMAEVSKKCRSCGKVKPMLEFRGKRRAIVVNCQSCQDKIKERRVSPALMFVVYITQADSV